VPENVAVAAVGAIDREPGQVAPAATLLGPATMFVAATLVAPLLLLLRYSLNRYHPTELMIETVTGANYLRFVTDPFYLGVLWTTLGVAVVSTLLCLTLGLPIAYRLARMSGRWKSALMLALILPLFIGNTVRMVGWMILFAHGGMIDDLVRVFNGRGLELMYTSTAVACGIVSINLPFVILTLQSTMETIDPRIEEAAQSLGAAPARRFWRVVWPLSLPGTAIAGVLCFILAMNAYATPFLLGGPRFKMMAPLLYWEFSANNNWPFASAIALILMATTLVLTAASGLLIPRRYRA